MRRVAPFAALALLFGLAAAPALAAYPSPTYQAETLETNPTWLGCPAGYAPLGGGASPISCVPTLPASLMPAPTASTLGGVESIAPVAHNFLTGISTAGAPSAAQPGTADLSDLGQNVAAALRAPLNGPGGLVSVGAGQAPYVYFCNGTDDTAGIAAALASYQAVYLSGICVASQVVLDRFNSYNADVNSQTLTGGGPGVTFLRQKAGSNRDFVVVGAWDGSGFGVNISQMSIDGAGASQSAGECVHNKGGFLGTMDNVHVYGCHDSAVEVGGDSAAILAGTTIANQGTGYANAAHATLTAVGGTCATPWQFDVTVSGNEVTAINSVLTPGNCYIPPSNPVATTGGGGSGATLNVATNYYTGSERITDSYIHDWLSGHGLYLNRNVVSSALVDVQIGAGPDSPNSCGIYALQSSDFELTGGGVWNNGPKVCLNYFSYFAASGTFLHINAESAGRDGIQLANQSDFNSFSAITIYDLGGSNLTYPVHVSGGSDYNAFSAITIDDQGAANGAPARPIVEDTSSDYNVFAAVTARGPFGSSACPALSGSHTKVSASPGCPDVGTSIPAPGLSSLGGSEAFNAVAHQWASYLDTSGVWHLAQPNYSDLAGVLPNPSASTLGGVESIAAAAHNFLTAISTAGVPSQAQPAYSDLAGTAAANSALRGPTSGAAASPTFRAPIQADLAPGLPGGFLNLFRNGRFEVWQRGASAITDSTSSSCSTSQSACMTADGWAVIVTGANTTTARAAAPSGYGSLYALQVTGAASNSDVKVAQRIESMVAAPLAEGQPVTVQFLFYQSTGSPVTPTVAGCYASTTDAFSTCTSDLAATSVSACATATWCLEALTFTPSANASNGYQITIDCGAILASKVCEIANADIRVTPGAAAGVNAAPPPPELRPVSAEYEFSYRYFQSFVFAGANGFNYSAYGAASAFLDFPFAILPMRVAPTATLVGTWSYVNASGLGATSPGPTMVTIYFECTALGACQALSPAAGGLTLSAEL